jgi:hypothetical protein
MAKNTINTLNDLFTDERIREVVDIYEQTALQNANATLEKTMFPEDRIYDVKVSSSALNRNISPTPYTGVADVPPVTNMDEIVIDETYALPTKKEQVVIDMQEFSSAVPKSITGDMIAKVQSSRNRAIFNLEQNMDARNRVEVWKYLTLGMLSSTGGDKELPFYGLDRDQYASHRVVFNWQPATKWFASSGAVNANADIMGDLSHAINYAYNNNYPNPHSIWMNSTTYAALLANTKMIASYGNPTFWKSADVANFLGLDLDRMPKGLRVTRWMVDSDVPIFVYDGQQTFQESAHTTTDYKFLPDYYVLVMPQAPGVRKSGLAQLTNEPGRAIKSFIDKPRQSYFENVSMYMEERSYPFPTTMGISADGYWRSHLILYVSSLPEL